MNKKTLTFWLLIIVLPAFVQCNKENSRWQLTFSDEFSGYALDTSVWRMHFPWGQHLSGKEQHLYIDSACIIKDGILKIKAKRDTVIGSVYDESWHSVQKSFYYTSGMIHSAYTFAQQYGYFETRCKIPFGKGLWPAYWLMAYSGWPPEIDICEFIGNEPDRVFLSNHFLNKEGMHCQANTVINGPDYSDDFHIYAIEWNPREIIWYIDNERVFNTETCIPQERMYLIFTFMISDSGTGYADPTTPLPAYFEIDYVRVYKEVN